LERTFTGHTSGVSKVAFSADAKRIISGGGDRYLTKPGELKVWEAQTGQELLSLQGHTSAVSCLAFSADGKRIASAGGDKTVKVWDVQTGQEELVLKGHVLPLTSVAFSPDGPRIVSGSGGEVNVWDASFAEEEAKPQSPPPRH
jgi:WD40 repeat protein